MVSTQALTTCSLEFNTWGKRAFVSGFHTPGQEWKEAEAAKQRLEDERRKEEAAFETHLPLRGSE